MWQNRKEASSTAREMVRELRAHLVALETQNKELWQSQQAIELALERCADLYDFAPVGDFTFGADGLIVEANLTGAGLLAVPHGTLIGRNFHGLVDPAHRDRYAGHIAGVLQDTDTHSCELTIRRHDGSVFESRLDSVRAALPGEPDSGFTIRSALFDISELRCADRERAAHARRLNESSLHLVAIQELERGRLSAELFDRTSPDLAAIRVNLATIAEVLPRPLAPALEALLADMAALVDDAAASISDISADLRPPVLDYAGLLAALESLAHQFGRRTGIAVAVDGTRFWRRPAHEHESLLFRIASEAFANCAKHSGARNVRVVLASEGQHVALTIADDGVGFDTERFVGPEVSRGQGLSTMRERAEFAGGSFHLESSPGRGTRIEVRV